MNRKRLIWTMTCLASLAASGCGGGATDKPVDLEMARSSLPRDLLPAVPGADLAELVRGDTELALALHRALKETGNTVVSPHSVSIALAMTWAGARGQTATEMAAALRFLLPPERLHPAFNALDLALSARGQGAKAADGGPFRLRVVNMLWAKRDYPIEAAFLDTLAVNYGAGVGLLDFAADPKGAAEAINDWISGQTEGRIPSLLSPGALSPLTRLVLTNAVYLNAAWRSQFDAAATAPAPFRLADGAQVQAPTMNQIHNLPCSAAPGLSAVELPFDGGELSMLFVVPDDLAAVEPTLDAERLAAIVAGLSPRGVKLALPRFKVELKASLVEPLSGLGMPVAFSDAADFSGITAAEGLQIADVVHQAFIEVREAGTEAAAATAVIIGPTSAPSWDVEVKVDRPFLYFIRDRATGAVLFMGRVVDPR